MVHLGNFVTTETAALLVRPIARSPQGQQPSLTSEEARQQARAEGLTLLVTNSKYNSKTGYFGVSQKGPERAKPFHAQETRDGRTTTLGSFSTAEEAALCIARSPEGQQEAAKRRLAPLTSEKVLRQQARSERSEFRVARRRRGMWLRRSRAAGRRNAMLWPCWRWQWRQR